MPAKGHIIAMGGGGFSMEPGNTLLDDYVLAQSRRSKPRICFLGSASGDAAAYVEKFYVAFSQQACEPTHLPMFVTPPPDIARIVPRQDVFYVGGGSTRNLLLIWREWGLDRLLAHEWRRGKVLAGLSAGSLCWFESGVSDSFGPRLAPVDALGWIRGSHCPHYDGEAERRPAYHALVASGELPSGYAADDGAALHFIGRKLHRIVSSRPNALAYRVKRVGRAVTEEPLQTDFLGARPSARRKG